MGNKWALYYGDKPHTFHVIPLNDLIIHDFDEDCICFPRIIQEKNGIIYSHNALDKREEWENIHCAG